MKRTLFSLFFTVAVVATASAQGGWDSSDSWGAPKKTAKKKPAASNGQAAGQNRAPGSEKMPVNDTPAMAAQPDASPLNAAPAPSDSGFKPGGGGGSAPTGQGMSVAPGSPMILQSGRTVMANDAAATRERRLNRMNKAKQVPAAAPTPVNNAAMLQSQATGAGAGMEAPAASPAAQAAVPAPQPRPAPAKATPSKSKKKAPAEPSGW